MSWKYLFCGFAIGQIGFVLTDDVWCSQCFWDTRNYYGSENNESIGNGCIEGDLDDITAYDPRNPNPIVNPICHYDQSYSSYKRLLEGPCTDYACYASMDSVCATWAIYHEGNLVNMTRLCAVPGGGPTSGCYHEYYADDEYYKEVCFCNNVNYCNSAWTFQGKFGKVLWISLAMSLVVWLQAIQ